MEIRNFKKICIYLLIVFLLFNPVILFNYSQNERIEKEIKASKLKPLDQEGQNYRLVTSADNVQVPVPKGYVASRVTGENYVTPEYRHTTITYKGNYTELQWKSPAGEPFPWTQDENGIWISGNQGISNSTSTIETEFDYIKGTTLTINYTYSSQYGDYFNIDLIDLTNNLTTKIERNKAGNMEDSFDYNTSNYTWTNNDWATGRYKIRATYSKDRTQDGGQDSAYIKISTYFKEDENGETIEIDKKTKIHDGGFVIYQLTDTEIAIDPNGTNVVIDDTNKDEAQSTRNQYVWVPMQNVEDIVKTKTINNGIMQFGQKYIFSNTSITKETDTSDYNLREPRLLDSYDKTKNCLQKNSYISKKENYLTNMQEDFNRLIKHTNKYKGYYIGRYETGDDVSHNYQTNYYLNPKIVRYNINIDKVNWYNSYNALKRISGKTGKYVETGMIYDTIWDYTLKWLNETDTRSYDDIYLDSGTWGNSYNNRFKYKTSANGNEIIKIENVSTIIPTGGIIEIKYKGETYSNSPSASNNIFDIFGNVSEWNISKGDYGRAIRGGNCYNNSNESTACNLFDFYKPTYTGWCSRCILYIK